MWFNKKAVEKELDKAAEELEKHGYVDLADKVDYYNECLMKVKSEKDIPSIRRGLERIEHEASRRQGKKSGKRTIDKRKLAELKKRSHQRKVIKALKNRKTNQPNTRNARLTALLAKRDKKISGEENVGTLKDKVRARRLARLAQALKK